MSHPDPLHDPENVQPEDISISDVIRMKEESEMDDDSDLVAEERSNEDFNQIQSQQHD